MQYTQPYGNVNPNAPYVNANPATATQGSIIPATAIEATQREIINAITSAGLAPSGADNTQLWQAIQRAVGAQGVVGSTRNLAGSAAGGTATAQWTLDEILASTALGAFAFKGFSLTLNFNGGTTGANGMDIGATPAAAALYVYAIYNPTSNTWATLGTIAGVGASIYPGVHMPAGYTASCLIWAGITAASHLPAFTQADRSIVISANAVIINGTATLVTPVSVGSLVPPCARSCSGYISLTGNGAVNLYSTAGSLGQIIMQTTTNLAVPFAGLLIGATQLIYYQVTSGTPTINADLSGYTI